VRCEMTPPTTTRYNCTEYASLFLGNQGFTVQMRRPPPCNCSITKQSNLSPRVRNPSNLPKTVKCLIPQQGNIYDMCIVIILLLILMICFQCAMCFTPLIFRQLCPHIAVSRA
jgi:hypothetical protein